MSTFEEQRSEKKVSAKTEESQVRLFQTIMQFHGTLWSLQQRNSEKGL